MIKLFYLDENKKSIYNEIINKFKNNKNSTILIYGEKSSCKSEISKYIFDQLNFIKIFYNIFNENDIFKEIYNFNNNNFNSILNNTKNSFTKGLIIDNLDFISLNVKKKYLKQIIIENLKYKKIPLIIICKNISSKLLEEIFKEKLYFDKYLFEYTQNEIYDICKYHLNLDNEIIKKLCTTTNYNIKIILNMYELYNNQKKKKKLIF